MQHDPPPPSPRPPADAPILARPASDVPSDQLWREAILAARQAASAAAELRQALQATRAGGATSRTRP